MARELSCPQCPQVLTVPDSMLGQTVRCPQCGGTFRTTVEGALIQEDLPPSEPMSHSPPLAEPLSATKPCPACQETIPTEALRCPFCDEDTQRPASAYDQSPGDYVRRDVIPHRGNIVLLLGVLSLVSILFAPCFGLPCVIGVGLGSAAWLMANADLRKMVNGDMDPGGESNTNAGKICGIIGIIICGLIVLACGAYLGAILGFQLMQK